MICTYIYKYMYICICDHIMPFHIMYGIPIPIPACRRRNRQARHAHQAPTVPAKAAPAVNARHGGDGGMSTPFTSNNNSMI